MSKSIDSLDLDDVIVAKSSPHPEIALPNTEISLDAVGESRGPKTQNVHHDKHGGPKINYGATEELSHYDHIDIAIETETGTTGDQKSEMDPKSVYELKATEGKQRLALKFREISTRQCKFEIGEEWEQFQTVQNQSVSCPSSPLASKREIRGQVSNKDLVVNSVDNKAFVTDEHEASPDKNDADALKKNKEPYPFHYLFTTPQRLDKECQIQPNPYNRLNQRFHSALQCPCFLFFFFLCCVPAVHYMQWSDRQFKKGNKHRAKHYGSLATGFYILGSIIGVTFLSVCIYFAADYVKQFVS